MDIITTNNKSHLTSMSRKKPSVPMRYLKTSGVITNVLSLNRRVLDYGCGRGFDCEYYGLVGYDPYFFPVKPKGKFKVITCHYVLNVLETEREITQVLQDIYKHLTLNGVAYITVRRDKFKPGYTKKGTFQSRVFLHLPIEKETSAYCMYRLEKRKVKAELGDIKNLRWYRYLKN